MINLSGRMYPGLDEFMLRLGHLKVISRVACEADGARHRVEKWTGQRLTSLCAIPESDGTALADYLFFKGLSPAHEAGVAGGTGGNREYRYPQLVVELESDGSRRVRAENGEQVQVSWQDLCLSSASVPSKVGAVNASAKSGSTTGVSHIVDWAETVGFITSTAQPTGEGKLLANSGNERHGNVWSDNPYACQPDRVLLGGVLIAGDLDLFSRLVARLIEGEWPIRKRAAAHAFAKALERVANEATDARQLTSRERFHLTDQLRELERAARRSRKEIGEASTTWHRAASRMESYVDLGILTKVSDGEKVLTNTSITRGQPWDASLPRSVRWKTRSAGSRRAW